MRLIDADELVYESIDSNTTGMHERYYGTGILAVRKEDIDNAPTIELVQKSCKSCKWVTLEYETAPDGKSEECLYCGYWGGKADKNTSCISWREQDE